MNKKLVILTGNDNFFGQRRKPWVSMDVEKIQHVFLKNGFDVERYCFHEIANHRVSIKNSIIFYTFSQKQNRKHYIHDLVHYLDDGSNILIPCYELLKCHENKGYQELYKNKIGLSSLKSFYFSSEKELPYYDINFPTVLKTVDTSNGKGVFLVRNQQQLLKLINRLERQSVLTKLDLVRRKYFRRKKSYPYYPDYSNKTDYIQYRDYILKEKNFILQEFVPDLIFDYRVLVLYDRIYVMKRNTKPNDFRASGAKLQEFDIEIDDSLLNYAYQIYQKFDTPFLSMDIGLYQNSYCLFEFQALHFGLNVLIKSLGFYTLDQNSWKFNRNHTRPDIESDIASAFVRYVRERYP